MPTIAVDAMGGDLGPEEVVRGVADVTRESDIQCLLVGDRDRVRAILEGLPYRPERLSIVHAGSTIGMHEEPRQALKQKKDASILVGVALVADGRADAMVSAGNTGACVLACARSFRPLPGIRQTALAAVFPRRTEIPDQDPLALLLDVGATVRCDRDELVQFALMGSAYAKRISKVATPKVGLLNMGAEPTQGGEVLVATHERLTRMPSINFVGNVEGQDVAKGRADVVVCEGLVGNIVLRLLEGISEVVVDLASHAYHESLRSRVGLAMLSPGIRRLRDLTDYESYGGSPILGFENVFIKSHGRSTARAIANAVKVAAKAVRDGVPHEIAELLAGTR